MPSAIARTRFEWRLLVSRHWLMRVFLTGATGLLGSHLAKYLVERGDHVVALVRSTSDTSFLESLGVHLAQGDVSDSVERLCSVMDGCSHVVHAAALVYSGRGWDAVAAVNVEGTRRVLMAAAGSGVQKAVNISSVAVYSGSSPEYDQNPTPVQGAGDSNHYARSKREAEMVARRVERDTGLPVTTVRPSAVYGERDRLLGPAIEGLLSSPVVPLFGPGENTLPVVYAGNVAVAIGIVLDSPAGGDSYDLGMDHPLTQRDFFYKQAMGMGRAPRFVRLPAFLVRSVALLFSRMGVTPPGAKHLSLERLAGLALEENPYLSLRAHRDLGWEPPHRHDEALRRTGRWLASR